MARYVEDLDLVRERALVAQEELMNRIAQEQNARTYLLSVVAAIFLPVTFISGLFGMNTAGLPGLEAESAFWIVSGVMAVVAIAIIIWLWLKKWFWAHASNRVTPGQTSDSLTNDTITPGRGGQAPRLSGSRRQHCVRIFLCKTLHRQERL